MNFEAIVDFVSKMEVRELGSFSNDLLQLEGLLEKNQAASIVCIDIDNEYLEIKNKISNFYNKIEISSNKKIEIETFKKEIIKSKTDEIIMGYYLFKQEINNNIFGYLRVINYWYPEHYCDNNYDAKQKFIRIVIKPFIELINNKIK